MITRVDRIKACLNGSRARGEHPALPTTPIELAAAAAGAVAAGAEAVHLHPRDRTGVESLRAEDVGAAVGAVRHRCPGVPVGVSTGRWISADREACIAEWRHLPSYERPDFASVNVSETGFTKVARLLGEAGIAVEAGVWSLDDADAMAILEPVPRVLVEVLDAPADRAAGTATAILDRLDALRVPGARLLHGEGDACWPLVMLAGRLGLPTRIGLEDTLVDPTGAPAVDNADLVRTALSVWSAAAVRAE